MNRFRRISLAEFKTLAKDGKAPDDVMLQKAFIADVVKEVAKADDGDQRPLYNWTISTSSPDRDRDIIAADGWKLTSFKRNPVVMWAHDYKQPPLGQASKTAAGEGKLISAVRFDSDISPFAAMIERMVDRGTLRAASVGFRPMQHAFNDSRGGVDFTQQELLEWSVVPIPANAEALIEARSAGIDLEPLREWASKILDETGGRTVTGQLEQNVFSREQLEAVYQAGRKNAQIIIVGFAEPVTLGTKLNEPGTVDNNGRPTECPRADACPNTQQSESCPAASDCPIAGRARPGAPQLQVQEPAVRVLEGEIVEVSAAELHDLFELDFVGISAEDLADIGPAFVRDAIGELAAGHVQAAINRHTGRVD